MGKETLFFVYNADSSMFAQASDFAHKTLSPKTYACDLCKLTYGNVLIKRQWKEFLESLAQEKVFLHKDELKGEYRALRQFDVPFIAYQSRGGEYKVVISAEELKEMRDLEMLIEVLQQKIER